MRFKELTKFTEHKVACHFTKGLFLANYSVMLMVNVGSPAGMDNVFNRNDLEMILSQKKIKLLPILLIVPNFGLKRVEREK